MNVMDVPSTPKHISRVLSFTLEKSISVAGDVPTLMSSRWTTNKPLQAVYARLAQMARILHEAKSTEFHIHLKLFRMKTLVDLGSIPGRGARAINGTGGVRRGESVLYQISGPTW
jgi:hypothetical protein